MVIGAVVLSNLVSFSSKSAVKHIAIASGEKALVKAKEVGKEKLASGKESSLISSVTWTSPLHQTLAIRATSSRM